MTTIRGYDRHTLTSTHSLDSIHPTPSVPLFTQLNSNLSKLSYLCSLFAAPSPPPSRSSTISPYPFPFPVDMIHSPRSNASSDLSSLDDSPSGQSSSTGMVQSPFAGFTSAAAQSLPPTSAASPIERPLTSASHAGTSGAEGPRGGGMTGHDSPAVHHHSNNNANPTSAANAALAVNTSFFHGAPISSNDKTLYIRVSGEENNGITPNGGVEPIWISVPWSGVMRELTRNDNLSMAFANYVRTNPRLRSGSLRSSTSAGFMSPQHQPYPQHQQKPGYSNHGKCDFVLPH